MIANELLVTLAQLALGLAGFTGIGVLFTHRPGELTPLEKYRLGLLFSSSFGAMFLALLPLWLHLVDLEASALWRIASAVMFGFAVGGVALFLRPTRRFLREAPEIFNHWLLAAITAGHVFNGFLQLLNALGLFDAGSPAVYTSGLLWMLAHSSLQFARILFIRPPAAHEGAPAITQHVGPAAEETGETWRADS